MTIPFSVFTARDCSIFSKLQRSKFRKESFCFLLEILRNKNHCKEIFEILKVIGQGMDRGNIIEDLKDKYPSQMEESKKYYELFLRRKPIRTYLLS